MGNVPNKRKRGDEDDFQQELYSEFSQIVSIAKMTSKISNKEIGTDPDLSYVSPHANTRSPQRDECWRRSQQDCQPKNNCIWRSSYTRNKFRHETAQTVDTINGLCEHVEDVTFPNEGATVFHNDKAFKIARIVKHPPILPTLIYENDEEVIVSFCGFQQYYGDKDNESAQYHCVLTLTPLVHGSVRTGLLNLFNFIKADILRELKDVLQSQAASHLGFSNNTIPHPDAGSEDIVMRNATKPRHITPRALTFTGYSMGGAFARLMTFEWLLGPCREEFNAQVKYPIKLRSIGEIPSGDDNWMKFWKTQADSPILNSISIITAEESPIGFYIDPTALLPHAFCPVDAHVVTSQGVVGQVTKELQNMYSREGYDLCKYYSSLVTAKQNENWTNQSQSISPTDFTYEFDPNVAAHCHLHLLKTYDTLIHGIISLKSSTHS